VKIQNFNSFHSFNICDFYLSGNLKQKVYRNNPHNINKPACPSDVLEDIKGIRVGKASGTNCVPNRALRQ
jgi:hypothetical protein